MSSFTDSLAHIGDLSVPFDVAGVLRGTAANLGDDELLSAQRVIAEVRRRVDATAAAIAGEIAHRSRRELGHDGLAQAHGRRTAEALISQLTGSSTRDARTLVKAAELLPASPESPTYPTAAEAPATWRAVVGAAVSRAAISIEAAEVILTRLAAADRPASTDTASTDTSTDTQLDDDDGSAAAHDEVARSLLAAAERLVEAAGVCTIEQLAVRAAQARDEIDLAGIPVREEALRDRRFLRFTKQVDGSTRISGLLDAESAAIVAPIIDAATSPRRGGPRFVAPGSALRADEIVRDERTTDQLTLDVVVDLVRAGARVDDGRLLGDRKPAVRILVTTTDLERADSAGAAYFEGQSDAVSRATAERYICASGAVPILFDADGRVLDLGRDQRLFSEKQRIALAARDGGCLMRGRPPSWCEAHHIDHWEEHHGRTDVDDGVLLCRFCHLLVHNRGWRIRREGAEYALERPDAGGTLRRTPLPSRSPARHRLLSA